MAKRDENGRFVKGASGNPGGRPVNESLTKTLREYIGQGKRREELVRMLYERAVKQQDLQAIRLIFEYLEGKPTQNITGSFQADFTSSSEWIEIRGALLAMVERQPDLKEALLDVFDSIEGFETGN